MMTFAIPFPAIDPILIEVGPLAIRWYSLAYIAGLLLGWWYIRRLVADDTLWQTPKSKKATKSPLTLLAVDDLLVWVTLGVILGGRFGYVLFYQPGHFISHPLEIFAVWRGGMSFHGGMLGVTLAMILFARRWQIPVLSVSDVVAATAPIGLFFGRIANFINAELYGRITDVPWAVVFPTGGPWPRHPSQLYQAAMEGLLLFLVLLLVSHRAHAFARPGLTTGTFLLGYAGARMVGELFRQPDAGIGFLWGGLTMGMALSIPMAIAGAIFIWYALRTANLQKS